MNLRIRKMIAAT